MKNISHSTGRAFVCLSLLFCPSCNKLREYIEHQPSEISKHCPVTSFELQSDDLSYLQLVHYKIWYDLSSRPTKLGLNDSVPYGASSPDNHFRYDRKGRLSDALITDPGLTFVYIWHRYTYPSPKLIIDSIFEYQGDLSDPNPPSHPTNAVRIDLLQLDAAGRPIHLHEYYTDPHLPIGDVDMAYDYRGNLVRAGVQYDDKINIYQTSTTWQLFFRDFSRNNPIGSVQVGDEGLMQTPVSYNAYGLPSKLLGPTTLYAFGLAYSTMFLHYACDAPDSSVSH